MIRALAFWIVLLVIPTMAADDPWEDSPPEVRAWYRGLMQPDNPAISCCGFADAYWADLFESTSDGRYIAIITDTREDAPLGRPHIRPGTRVEVPNHKLKYDAKNPTGHGVIFMNTIGTVYCYVTPSGI